MDCRSLEKDVSLRPYVESTKEKAYQQTCTEPDIVGATIVAAKLPHQEVGCVVESDQIPLWSWASVLGDVDPGIYCKRVKTA
jgi:hypothetical protein